MATKFVCVAGARPNFMKIAPLVRALNETPDLVPVLVHTGQHYDDRMSGQFFRDLGIPDPDHHLGAGSGSHAQQTAEIMKRFEPVLLDEQPAAVIVVGDVNSTMACALVAAKLLVRVVHVEAGLRSFDRTMPEEINRVVTDAISDLLLVTEESGRKNLIHEGIAESRIHLVGNLMIDSLRANLSRAQDSKILSELGVIDEEYGVVTLHRPANVDRAGKFQDVIAALVHVSKEVPLLFPVHPRTKSQLDSVGLPEHHRIRLIEPLGYLDFLKLLSSASVVLTDSGGIQEETTVLGVPCLTLRENTERPVTIEEGTNILAGTSKDGILTAWEQLKRKDRSASRIPALWDGKAAERAVEVLRGVFGQPG